MWEILRDGVLMTLLFGGFGLAVHPLHPERIPYVAGEAHDILVPCPEKSGAVTALSSTDPRLAAPQTVFVDARRPSELTTFRKSGAMSIPYDYLEPTPKALLAVLMSRIGQIRAQQVIVFGDGAEPDSGEQLAKEISAAGIQNVFFIKGGAFALGGPAAERKP